MSSTLKEAEEKLEKLHQEYKSFSKHVASLRKKVFPSQLRNMLDYAIQEHWFGDAETIDHVEEKPKKDYTSDSDPETDFEEETEKIVQLPKPSDKECAKIVNNICKYANSVTFEEIPPSYKGDKCIPVFKFSCAGKGYEFRSERYGRKDVVLTIVCDCNPNQCCYCEGKHRKEMELESAIRKAICDWGYFMKSKTVVKIATLLYLNSERYKSEIL